MGSGIYEYKVDRVHKRKINKHRKKGGKGQEKKKQTFSHTHMSISLTVHHTDHSHITK